MNTGTTTARTNWRPLNVVFTLLLALASVLPLLAALRHHTYLNDDTYITLTYAQNLAQGHGFVFNHGPPTLGTTTPLLTLIVALLGSIIPGIEVHVIAVVFTAICWLGTAWVVYLYRRTWQLSAWQASLVGLAILGTGWISFLGMEVYLFSFLLMLSLSLFYARRHFLTGLCLGLLFLTRGEGILVLGLLAMLSLLNEWYKQRKFKLNTLHRPLVLTVGFALPVALWSLYAIGIFGSVLPNTLSAKQAQGALDTGRPFLERLLQDWLPMWGKTFVAGHWSFLNLWWLLVLVGVIYAATSKHRRQWLVLLLWIAMYVAGYSILGVSAYWWYQLPIVFVAQVYLGLGIVFVVDFVMTRQWSIMLRTIAISAVTVIIVVGLFQPIVLNIQNYQGYDRASSYLTISQWFRENTQPSDSVAFIEIGYLGYYTNNQVIDLAGLVLPEIVPHVKEGDFEWGFWKYEPDYVIHHPMFDWALGDIFLDSRFQELYQTATIIPGPDNTAYTIYKRTTSIGDPRTSN